MPAKPHHRATRQRIRPSFAYRIEPVIAAGITAGTVEPTAWSGVAPIARTPGVVRTAPPTPATAETMPDMKPRNSAAMAVPTGLTPSFSPTDFHTSTADQDEYRYSDGMDLADLELVVTTVEAGTLTLAAERLHVAQPALTRRLARLERELGGTLFERGRRGAHATPAGETLADGAVEVLRSVRSLERRTRDAIAGRIGHLRIGTAPTLGADILPAVLAAHRRAHPDVDLDVTSSGDSDWLLREVAARRLDVALTVVPDQLDPDLVLAVSRRQTFVLVVPSGHPLAELDVVPRSKLAPERLVAIRAGEGLRQLLDRVFPSSTSTPR